MYLTYGRYLAERFGCKMQKLTVDAGFTCPNRDGTKGRGGCSYCNNRSFSPLANNEAETDVVAQLERGKEFFRRKYPDMKYLAYFQSYTNTYGDTDRLMALYERAMEVDDVEGIVIGTRPDCVSEKLLGRLAKLNRRKRVIMEYGAESSHDATLERVNRCHTWADTVRAVTMSREAGLDTGLHLIVGLPGETLDMVMATVDAVNQLMPDTVKFHQLQLIRGTRLAGQVERGEEEIPRFSLDEYIDICCKIVNRLDSRIAIDRFTSQSPDSLLIYPRWGIKNYQFINLLNARLQQKASATGMLQQKASSSLEM